MTTAVANRPSRSARRRWWWLLWGLVAVTALGTGTFAGYPYLTGEASRIPLNPDVAGHYLTLVIHGLPGMLVLLIGPLQFLTPLRVRYPQVHRVIGRVYVVGVLAASVAAVGAATFSVSGLSVQVAFFILVAAWLFTLAKAYRAIRRGEFALHRIWMIRNYALTFAAATLRIYLVIGLALRETAFPELPFDQIYTTAVWASFLGNALVAEYFIVQRTLVPLARPDRRRLAGRRGQSPTLNVEIG